MKPLAFEDSRVAPVVAAEEHAARVAVVAALSATTMLFASLASAYLLRRSFDDWRPGAEIGALVLAILGGGASAFVEIAFRASGAQQRAALRWLTACSVCYLLAALSLIVARISSEAGLADPHGAFVVLLLGLHAVHAALGVLFARSMLPSALFSSERWFLVRLVTHFLTLLLFMILGLLFVLQ